MNIHPVAFIDASGFTASYTAKYRAQAYEASPGFRVLDLDLLLLEESRAAKALLTKMKAFTGEIAEAKVADLAPGAFMPWTQDEGLCFVMTLLPSPGLRVMCGVESAMPMVGDLLAVNRGVPHCLVNFAPFSAAVLYLVPERADG